MTGGKIVNERGTVVTFRQKCESCGFVHDWNKTTIVPAYGSRKVRAFTCPSAATTRRLRPSLQPHPAMRLAVVQKVRWSPRSPLQYLLGTCSTSATAIFTATELVPSKRTAKSAGPPPEQPNRCGL
jgi:hypothetical protein